ncbi:putative E3 ubiquitin-protein ligase [Forsythia ovata]|uniref:RING-type E3 ubiquitin transferase n=1 Tax=Forsythia ovata TaxID=205694 RepID=A0ABD1WGH0_9LAMI
MKAEPPEPYVEHEKAVTIRNDVNLKKEILRIKPDQENLGKFLVAFTFDATLFGSITIVFFAKEGEDCCLTPTKKSLVSPIMIHFQQGLAHKFKQPSRTGIDFSMFEETEFRRVKWHYLKKQEEEATAALAVAVKKKSGMMSMSGL